MKLMKIKIFLNWITFTAEVSVNINGQMNGHNCRVSGEKNSRNNGVNNFRPSEWRSPENSPWMTRGGIDVWLYCFLNLSARLGWVFNAMLRPLYPRVRDPASIVQEDGWAPGPFCTDAEYLTLSGILALDSLAHSGLLYLLCYRPTIFHLASHIAHPTPTQLSTERHWATINAVIIVWEKAIFYLRCK